MIHKSKNIFKICILMFALSFKGLFSITVYPYNLDLIEPKQISDAEKFCQKKFLRKGDTVFDVGANVGNWTINALKAQPNLQVYAFEPIPQVARKLKENLRKRGVKVFRIAFDSSPQLRAFNIYDKSTLSGFWDRQILREKFNLSPQKIEVETQTIDGFCEKQGIKKINYLKIDTEGAELAVLQGAKHLIENMLVPVLQFEYGGCYEDSKTTLEEVYQFLQDRGYEIFYQAPKCLIHLCQWSDSMENYQWCNCIAVHHTMLNTFNLSCCWKN